MFGRLSFCCFLLCVIDSDPKAKKWPVWTFLVLQVVVNMVAVFLLSSGCGSHLEVVFNMNITGFQKYCMDLGTQTNYAYFAGCEWTLIITDRSKIAEQRSLQYVDRSLPHRPACRVDHSYQIGNRKQNWSCFVVLLVCSVSWLSSSLECGRLMSDGQSNGCSHR